METIKIEVYGGINAGGGGCSCGCTSCTPADSRAEYEVMKKVLMEHFSEGVVSLEFIDTGSDPGTYPEIEKVIRAGYSFPVTCINGTPRLAGGIPADTLIEIINELQTKS